MAKYYSALRVKCDGNDGKDKPCRAVAEFPNPERLPGYKLEWLAIGAGWYIAWDGNDLCPRHHREKASTHNWPSLYAEPVLRTLPISPAAPGIVKPKEKKDVQRQTS